MSTRDNDFYSKLEKRFRGTRELILSRANDYSAFINAIKSSSLPAISLDLGCGRGEFVEFLSQHGFDAKGIDIDEGMLAEARQQGLNVEHTDALEFLEQCDNDTFSLISAIHVVEHISFDDLVQLSREACRALVPGGILILETPNPENLAVGTHTFYLDPTHQTPIPPTLLEFVTNYAGFQRGAISRLHGPEQEEQPVPRLADVITGVSPDYAVIAQKTGPFETLEKFNKLLEQEQGVSLARAVDSYDRKTGDMLEKQQAITEEVRNSRSSISDIQYNELFKSIERLQQALLHYQKELAQTRHELTQTQREVLIRQTNFDEKLDSLMENHAKTLGILPAFTEARSELDQVNDKVRAVWLLITPVRLLHRGVHLCYQKLERAVRPLTHLVTDRILRIVDRRPTLAARIVRTLEHVPVFHSKISALVMDVKLERGQVYTTQLRSAGNPPGSTGYTATPLNLAGESNVPLDEIVNRIFNEVDAEQHGQ